jgi:hypothetical protein
MPTDDQKLQYLQLQQEADFSLWKTREAMEDLRKSYALLARGQGPGPSKDELEIVARLEQEAGEKYRALRDFVRAFFN